MPGTLLYAAPATVLPQSLWAAFVLTDTWPTVCDPYPDGNFQVRCDGVNPRLAWKLTRKLTYAKWTALKAFWEAQRGGYAPFYFYPMFANYDATGVSATGRYTVRFDGQFPSTFGLARGSSDFGLIQLA
jgi:phage-related protein